MKAAARPATEGRAAAPGRGVTPLAGPRATGPEPPGAAAGLPDAATGAAPGRAAAARAGGRRQAARPFSPPSLPQRLTFRGGRAPP